MLRGEYDDGTVTVSAEGVPLVRYRGVTAAGEPHVDHLALPPDAVGAPAGRNVVLAGAHDHPWHLGCFFAPNYVDGVSCWGGRPEDDDRGWARAVDRGHGLSRGRGTVTVDQRVEWRTDDELLLDDERTVTVDDTPDRGYLLVWDQTVEATQPRTVEGTDLSAGRGSYGGFNVRFQREMADGEVRLPDEDDPEDRTGPTGTYCDYTGPLDGRKGAADPWRAGATVFLDGRTAADQRWFVAREYPFVGANPTWGEALELDAGEAARWRWGVWVRGGRPDASEIERVEEGFRADE